MIFIKKHNEIKECIQEFVEDVMEQQDEFLEFLSKKEEDFVDFDNI